jgi:isovaleryl-CoA dehydrogenase
LDGVTTGDVFLVYARTGPGRTDVTQFIVEKNMLGFSLGQQIKNKLGMRASMTAELVFDNVRIPQENVVGQVNQATLCMMRNLEVERIGLAAMGLGIARRCLDEMKQYCNCFGRYKYNGLLQKAMQNSWQDSHMYTYRVASVLDLNTYGNGLDVDYETAL